MTVIFLNYLEHWWGEEQIVCWSESCHGQAQRDEGDTEQAGHSGLRLMS